MTDPICIFAAGQILTLAATAFTLSWSHSVEHMRWTEQWRTGADGLVLVEATVHGSGAGMEPPDGAVTTPEGWSYRPALPPIQRLVLAASGATSEGWRLCTSDTCIALGEAPGPPIELWRGADSSCGVKPKH